MSKALSGSTVFQALVSRVSALEAVEGAVSVLAFGATGDGVTDDTSAFAAAYAYAVAHGKEMLIPAGTYRAWLVITASNVTIRGEGSAVTTIKLPDNASHTLTVDAGPGTATGVPCVLDFGQIGAGNSATVRSGAHVSGLTLDGNASGTAVPTSDLFGWGLSFVAYSNATYYDVVAQNCHCGGVGVFINSNNHIGSFRTSNCGNSTVSGSKRPGFDNNSSKYGHFQFVSVGDAYGGRLLDNCWGNIVTGTVYNATLQGFIYSNQLVNDSHGNTITVVVESGCSDYGLTIGANCRSSDISVTTNGITGTAVRDLAQASPANNPTGNHITVSSRNSGQSSCIIESNSNEWNICSTTDGLSGGAGSVYAVRVLGSDNVMKLAVTDSTVPHVRGLQFTSTALRNQVVAYTGGSQTVESLNDAGAGNRYFLRGTAVYDPPSLANNTGATAAVTVSGAKMGMVATVGFTTDTAGMLISASVQSADTVTVRFFNDTGGTVDLDSGTLTAIVQSG